jgi:hypothetical protein
MIGPKLTPTQKSTCKTCLAELDRAIGSFAYAQALGADLDGPIRQARSLQQGIHGMLELAQTSLADLELVESPGVPVTG